MPATEPSPARSSEHERAAGVREPIAGRSLDDIRETILRRIMRAACVLGLLGLGAGALAVRPLHVASFVAAAISTAAIFGATLLPARLRVLSTVYPWVLAGLGALLLSREGPEVPGFLLIAGALFIGSLALHRWELVALIAVAVLLGGAGYLWSPAPVDQKFHEHWLNGVNALISVVGPAAIAGRMLVGALEGAIHKSDGLVRELLAESTAREAALVTLETTRTQLTHAQKVELLGQLAGGIAHDMNNALTGVMGEASLLDDRVVAGRERIMEAAIYAGKLTRQLMVLGRRDISQPRPVDLAATITSLLQSIRRVIPSEVTLTWDPPRRAVPVLADATQLLQVLLNLAANARDAMPNGGRLTLSLRVDDGLKAAFVEVRDTGTGIAPGVLPEIFEPFFTTKAPGKGTGLGLANVKQLVEAMGGAVEVESELGKGTTFRLRLPLTDKPISRERTALTAGVTGGGTVLVVDDDVRVRAVVFTTLEQRGYHVLEAATAEAATALVGAEPKGIDLLLTDVVLRQGGGAQVIDTVKRVCPRARVLVMSGYNDDERLRRGIEQGTFPFIAKPFSADELAGAVAEALSGPHQD